MTAELCETNLVLSEVDSGKRHGPRPLTLDEVAARIISRSVPDGECLIWTGATTRGYGMVLARGTEAVAAEIARDGIWQVVARHGMSYQHALRIRNGWHPKKAYQPALAEESVA